MSHNITELISSSEISVRVKELAVQITRDYAGEELTLICALKGGVVFFADLMREIDLPVRLEFVKVSSYGESSESSGKLQMDFPIKTDLTGKHVLIVEDIVDMGYTARWLREYFAGLLPKSVKLCALLDKPERRKVEACADYVGFTIPDEFVVGYGLDYAQQHRNLPFIGKLKIEVHP